MNFKSLNNQHTYIITGVAGFIGYHLAKKLLEEGGNVVGIDNLNDYYDPNLKRTRLGLLEPFKHFTFEKLDISNKQAILQIFDTYKPHYVVHLAAQAGVRYSIENPEAYIHTNIIGFHHILEACRIHPVHHLVYASSSSVYGSNKKVPFEETDNVDLPQSLYAATKKSNELQAYTYSHLYGIPTTGLRFFTVYGPLGRPDMAYFGFSENYFAGRTIRVYNSGDFDNDLHRDFTYIDDIIEGVARILNCPPLKEKEVPHEIYNIGNNQPIKLMTFIQSLEKALSTKLKRDIQFEKIYEPLKPGDVPITYASTTKLEQAVGFKPKTPIEEGLKHFANWYIDYYNHK